ncbi:hypothetical protein, partial [uncultured Rikenella sp.]|uniref:hypothetical protein n=1 Tax=uncultured Rikenella sp. TaxID=368003 RepID=UPI00260B0E7A
VPTVLFGFAKVGNHARLLDAQNVANQRKGSLRGGDFPSSFLLYLLLHRKGEYIAVFCVSREKKNS